MQMQDWMCMKWDTVNRQAGKCVWENWCKTDMALTSRFCAHEVTHVCVCVCVWRESFRPVPYPKWAQFLSLKHEWQGSGSHFVDQTAAVVSYPSITIPSLHTSAPVISPPLQFTCISLLRSFFFLLTFTEKATFLFLNLRRLSPFLKGTRSRCDRRHYEREQWPCRYRDKI
jgi:hypothetical protein